MTYRHLIQRMKQLRRDTTPDIRSQLPLSEPVKPTTVTRYPTIRIIRGAVAVAACVAILVAAALIAPNLIPDTPSLPTDSSSNPATQPITQPLTPPVTEPQKPVFNTVVRTLSLAAPSSGGGLSSVSFYPETFTFSYNPDETFNLDDHLACGNVCYSAATGYFFCPGCTLKELLKGTKGINVDKILVKHFSPAQNKALFICGRKSYIYDFKTNTLKNVNVDLYNTGTEMERNMSGKESAYALIPGTPGYWLVNLDTAEIVQVAKAGKDGKNYPTSDGMTKLSRGCKYVYYILADGEVYPTKVTTVFLNLETRERTLIKGSMMDSTPDDRYFTILTEDGLQVFDTEKNQLVPFEGSGIPEVYRYQMKTVRPFESVGDDFFYHTVSVYDLITEETVYTLDCYAAVAAPSIDRRYIYAYVRGESAMRVVDLTTMQEGIAPLEQDFLERMSDDKYTNYDVFFTLTVHIADGTVLLSYRPTDRPRRTIEEYQAALEELHKQQSLSPSYTFKEFMDSGKFISIASLEAVLEKHPDIASYLLAFEGDGYMCLYYNALYASYYNQKLNFPSNSPFILVEDYRSNETYIIEHNNGTDQKGTFSLLDRQFPAPKATAQAETCALLEKYGVTIRESTLDYGEYVKDGEFLRKKMLRRCYSPENIIGNIKLIWFDKTRLSDSEVPNGTRTALESTAYITKAEEFVRFAESLTWAKNDQYSDPLKAPPYQYTTTIEVSGDVFPGQSKYNYAKCTYNIGVYNGKPYIGRNDYRSYITQEEYDYWIEWFSTGYLDQYIVYEPFVDPFA